MNLSRTLPIIALAAVAAQALPQQAVFEFENDRIPALKTGGNCLIKHGKLMTVTHGTLADTDILVKNGKIAKIGRDLAAPAGFAVIDASGMIVTPGIVDSHSHRGITEVNEGTDSVTAEVQMTDVIDPQQDGLFYHLANGVTSALTLHGSGNAIGGQSVVTKQKWHGTVEDMIFPNAPRMLKFALGENPKRPDRDSSGRYPVTRMGVESIYRRAFADAKAYMKLWDDYKSHPNGPAPRKDLRLETLADILRGRIWVQCHSYRQDEMLMMARLSKEFGFRLTLQHALESYKIAPELAEMHIPVSMFASAWAYKIEVYDAIPLATSLCIRAGVETAVNTDSFTGLAPLQQDAGKAMRYGISEDDALKTVTLNPARMIGIGDRVGSLDEGKDADIAIWKGNPLGVYSRCETTLVDGEVMFQRKDRFGLDAQSTTRDEVHTTQQVEDEAAPLAWSDTYVIEGATVHPIDGPEIPNGRVVVRGNKIVAVGANVSVPSGAVVLNAKGMHVYPGFIDGGSDLGLSELGEVSATQDNSERSPFNPDLLAVHAINPETTRIPIARCSGITTAHVGPGGGVFSGTSGIIDLAGYTREQLTVNDHEDLVIQWPGKISGFARFFLPLDQIEKADAEVVDRRKEIEEYFAQAKAYAEARKVDPEGTPLSTKWEALIPYVNGEKTVMLIANAASEIKSALAFGKKLNLKIAIYGGSQAWRVAKDLADAGVPVILNPPAFSCPSATGASEGDPYDAPFSNAALLRAAGVKIGVASGSSEQIHDLANRTGMYCARGLSHDDAMRALTLSNAEILGISDRVGSLTPGKVANIVVTDGDPLETTTHVRYEFIGGKPITLKSKFTELYRKYEKRLKK
ncbi:MAG: amidohydrolase family protein [Armatimonadetes bacterium]|nr:amidohydrolase family protein [Armatimonadota bacterium]